MVGVTRRWGRRLRRLCQWWCWVVMVSRVIPHYVMLTANSRYALCLMMGRPVLQHYGKHFPHLHVMVACPQNLLSFVCIGHRFGDSLSSVGYFWRAAWISESYLPYLICQIWFARFDWSDLICQIWFVRFDWSDLICQIWLVRFDMSQIVRFDLSAVQHFEAAVLCSSCHVMLVHLDRRDLCLEECIFMIKATFAAARWCFILCYVTARRQGRPWGLEVNTGRRWNAVEKTCYEAIITITITITRIMISV